MSSGKKKKEEQFWATQSQQAYQNAQKKSPLEQMYEQSQMDFLNWDKSAGKDVRNAPGMDSYIQLGEAAQAKAAQDRMGTGALALAAPGASGYANQLKELNQAQMGENFGAGLENALNMRRAEATGSVLPLASLDQDRRNAAMGYAGNMFSTYLNRPKTGFWNNFKNSLGTALGQSLGKGAGASVWG